MINYDITIIGAGISGINLAIKLKKRFPSKRIGLFDKSSTIGGRIQSTKINSTIIEKGAARFNKNHKQLLKLIKDYNLKKNLIKIPSYWKCIYTNPKYDRFEKKNKVDIHSFINKLVTMLSKKDKHILQKYTLYELCLDKYGKEYSDYLVNAYSYYSEVCVLNSYDALYLLKEDLNEDNSFYILGGGLSQLTKSMIKHFKELGGILKLKYSLEDIDINDSIINLTLLHNNKTVNIKSKKIVLACDGYSLQKMKFLKKLELNYLIKSVKCEPLLRTYFKYDMNKISSDMKTWLLNLKKTVSNDKIKFIIPIDNKKGVVMISYTDGKYAKVWSKYIENNTQLKEINKSLTKLYPHINFYNNPPKIIENYYWNEGACYWKKCEDSTSLYKKMLKPLKDKELYICGDTFSHRQAWIEGALNTSNDVFKLISK